MKQLTKKQKLDCLDYLGTFINTNCRYLCNLYVLWWQTRMNPLKGYPNYGMGTTLLLTEDRYSLTHFEELLQEMEKTANEIKVTFKIDHDNQSLESDSFGEDDKTYQLRLDILKRVRDTLTASKTSSKTRSIKSGT